MNEKAEALKRRTHDFFMRVIRFCRDIPPSPEAHSIVEQLLDSAGSTDSNYRAACKARSKKEFAAKVGVAAEEADESLGWLRSLQGAGLGDKQLVGPLIKEANELTSIFVASHKTAATRLLEDEQRRRGRRRRIDR